MTDHRADGRRLGESLSAGFSMSDLLAQRRLGETVRDVERRLIAESGTLSAGRTPDPGSQPPH